MPFAVFKTLCPKSPTFVAIFASSIRLMTILAQCQMLSFKAKSASKRMQAHLDM